MTYQELKAVHAKRINDFPLRFAFSSNQFDDVVKELGPPDTLVSIGGGGILRKTDRAEFDRLFELCESEMETAKKEDAFLEDAIKYELGNHEYSYTGDPSDTIDVLDLDMSDARVKRVFASARIAYLTEQAEWEAANEVTQ